MKNRAGGLGPWARAAQVSAMAMQFAVASAAGIMAGAWADEKLGTSPWLVLLGMVLGLLAGVEVLIVMIRRFEKEEKGREEEKRRTDERR